MRISGNWADCEDGVLRPLVDVILSPKPAILDDEALDSNVLGRDVMNHFDSIVSYRRREVLLLATAHGYQVTS